MKARPIRDGVDWMGAVDWNRRLFDSLIPLPDGTSYNAYLVRGTDKTALIDTADPARGDLLMEQLADVPRVDYVVANHAEQDHSGSIPRVLARYQDAVLLTTAKGKEMVIDHLHVDAARIRAVADGETLALGGRTFEFMHMPWVHWPETMVTYLKEDRILFSCDFFGSHLATTDLYASGREQVYEPAKRYYAEIMMPFRKTIQRHLDRLKPLAVDVIAPSHGPMYAQPAWIVEAYRDWVSDAVKNEAVLAYASMHGSTEKMAAHLTDALARRGVKVCLFDLAATDLGKLAIALVDAATIVIGTPTVHVGPHPLVFSAAHLANALRPKARFASIIGSYGWSSKAIDQIQALIPALKVEVLDPVLCKGCPRQADYEALDRLAAAIAQKHAGL